MSPEIHVHKDIVCVMTRSKAFGNRVFADSAVECVGWCDLMHYRHDRPGIYAFFDMNVVWTTVRYIASLVHVRAACHSSSLMQAVSEGGQEARKRASGSAIKTIESNR